MVGNGAATQIVETEGLSVALLFSYRDDLESSEDIDELVADLCKLAYEPVKLVWERQLTRGLVTETCVLVRASSHWTPGMRRDVLQLAATHRMDAVALWSVADGQTVFRDTANGRDFVAWDAIERFSLDECRRICWDRIGPRFTRIGDDGEPLLRDVHRYDSDLPHPVHPSRIALVRKRMFGTGY